MRTLLKIAGLAPLLAACNLTSQASANTLAVSTLLTTPEVAVSGLAVAGHQLDGGFTVPAQQLVFAFFGQRQGGALDVAPVGLAGATASLTREGGPTWPLVDQGGGQYALSDPDGGFAYQEGASYAFGFVLEGVTYTARVEQVPGQERVPAFHPAEGFLALDAGSAFTFRRPDPLDNLDLALGFVTVVPIAASGSQLPVSYTNVPTTPLQFLKLVVVPSAWKQSLVTIPGTAFPQADANYVVILQSAKLGGPASDNLFLGSPVLAGTGEVVVVRTRP